MDREEKAFEFAQETIKQILTLSTGIIALTVTFLKDVLPKGTDTSLLEWAWGTYLGSILFGLIALMTLTGTLGDSSGDINRGGVRAVAGAQIVLFFVALLLTILFGFKVF
jgi:hypothetical protein